jgi:LysR family transcriptional regulator, nitrogen assimilation regulatory protein
MLMEARTLRYFQAVAEFGSYSRASEFLRISQPAVSRQVRRLEGEVGRPLLIRNGHGVTLTEPGRLLLERSQAILRQIDRALTEVKSGSATPSGTVTLAVPPAAGLFLVPALTARFQAAYPSAFLKIAAGYSSYIHEWLVRGTVDLACLHDPLPHRGFEITPLLREAVFLVGRPGGFPFPDSHVGMAELACVPLILTSRPNASRRMLDSLTAQHGIRLSVRMEVDDSSIIKALLRDGVGFSLLTQGSFLAEVRHGELEARPFRPALHWPLALVMSSTGERPELADAVAGMIRETVQALTGSAAWPGELLAR